MKNIKTVKTNLREMVNPETGEILDVTVNNTKVYLSKDKFALVYTHFWNAILEARLSNADIELFSYLISNYGDNTPFQITSYIKQQVSNKTGKKLTSYNNSTRKLLEYNFIYKIEGKNYKINPVLAFEGSSNNRKKAVIEMIEICPNCL